ncbi:MAG: enoyl-CoA hydratase/isomerase family protein [Rhodobacteraceae bacterium]|nr:enoyl-CoA hydratase/isomerase family protein [Paracoccaceae bacterium]
MTVRCETRGPVLILTIDRPGARNALDAATQAALIAQWRHLRDDGDLRVAVLTGAGEAAFCAGADLRELGAYYRSMTPLERRERGETEPGLAGLTRNFDARKPVIAAINGACLAGGLELALACDIRVAAGHATFGLPEVSRGILPGAGGTQRLPRSLPRAVAMEMILSGAPIGADAALRWGLVSRVVPAPELLDCALEIAGRIAANGPLAVRAARDAVLQGAALPLDQALRLEQFHAEPLRQSADAKEGVRAFIEKRPARFTGK